MKFESKHGSVLLAVTVFIVILAMGVTSVMELSLSNNKLSQRNEIRARARAVAESELELLYHAFSTKVAEGRGLAVIGDLLAVEGVCDNGDVPTTLRAPFLQMHWTDNAGGGWRVYRSFMYDASIGTVFGIIPGSKKTGRYAYYNSKVIVRPPVNSPFAANDSSGNDIYASHPENDPMAVRIGRHMTTSTTSIFQYNVFYQNDLEMAPGGNTILDGDIASNGNTYLSAVAGGSLTIKGQVRYLLSTATTPTYFNKDASNVSVDFSHTLRKPETFNPGNTLLDPVFMLGATTFDAAAHDYSTSTANTQVETMAEKENLLGGADANVIAVRNPGLFGPTDTPANLEAAINNVYRAVLSPPPDQAAAAEYPSGADLSSPDDTTIAALRLYNRAAINNGLIITVGSSGVLESITKNGVMITSGGAGTLFNAIATSVVTNKGNIHDWRENKDIATTEINVGALKTALESSTAGYSGFSGILYVNLKNSTTSNPAALRLINGATTPHPNFDPASTDPAISDPKNSAGFSVATNGGLYVKGNYNITALGTDPVTGTQFINPAMLMGDAVTVLSDNWDDAHANDPMTAAGGAATANTARLAQLAIDTTPFNNQTLTRTMVVAAGILTGGVPASEYHTSGGAQNLVRYLEDWTRTPGTNDYKVQFYGSMGNLFDSRYLTAPYVAGVAGFCNVYYPPSTRTFTFNSSLKLRSPQGTPTITAFSRGNFFLWDAAGT
jgi:hypothetical protein